VFLWLSELLRADFGPMNVFRYVTFRTVGAMGTALLIALLLYPMFIRRLQARQLGQVVREDGLQTHLAKAGTPTMGGILILIAIGMSTLLWADLRSAFVWLTIIPTMIFGVLGFMDDYLKIRDRDSKGVTEKQKLTVQVGTAAGASLLMYSGLLGDVIGDTRMFFPFTDATTFFVTLPWWLYAGFSTFVIIGYSNAVNLTDGQDGLAIGPMIVASFTFILLCYLAGSSFGIRLDDHAHSFDIASYLLIPSVPGAQELAPVLAAVAGAGIGFLWYNTHPAQVFMGDVGALALGGTFAMVAILSKNEWLSVLIGGIFVVEIASSLIQRMYYRRTGKRVFLMAPIHHHFEKKGWPEQRITVRFWIIAIVLSLLALASLKLR